MTKKITEEIYPFGSQYPKVSNFTRKKDLKKSTKKFGGTQEMKSFKTADKIYAMAIVKECSNLSKEDKLAMLEFILKEPDVKRIKKIVEEYVEIDEGMFERVEEATKRVKSLFYTSPAGKKDLKFAGKKPLARNRQLSKVLAREGKKLSSKESPAKKTVHGKPSANLFKPYK
jgi:hypothetical protein